MWWFRKEKKEKEEKNKKTPEEFVKNLEERIEHIKKIREMEKVKYIGLWTIRLRYDNMFAVEGKPWVVSVVNRYYHFVELEKFENYEDALKFFEELSKELEKREGG